MPSPTTNGPVSSVPASGDADLDSLLYLYKWGGGAGSGLTLTYSFPTFSSLFSLAAATLGYGSAGSEIYSGFDVFTTSEKALARAALRQWSNVANITFQEVADTASNVGDMRFAWTNRPGEGGHAYAPVPNSGAPTCGDVWLSYAGGVDDSMAVGQYGFVTLLHEIGHALGLKHPFENTGSGAVLSDDLDQYGYTVMSYELLPGYNVSAHTIDWHPTTPMPIDILAIQYLYGANMAYHTGNDTYTFGPNDKVLMTIWDAGGNDTIRFASTVVAGEIDLRPGHFSDITKALVIDGHTTVGDNLAIAYNCTIENAVGGGGSDELIGNSAANTLTGMGGRDTISGGDGNDNINGGAGGDRIQGEAGNDRITWGAGDVVNGGSGLDTLKLVSGVLDLVPLTKKVLGIEQVDLRGGTDGVLTLNRADVLEMSPTDHLRIFGDAGDKVDISGSFARGAVSGASRTYDLGGGALLTIETDVAVS